MEGFKLPPEQCDLLENLLQDPKTPVALKRRAEILLKYSAGRTVEDIAAGLGIGPTTVQRWLRAYESDGLEIFPEDFRTPPPKLEDHPSESAVQPGEVPDPTPIEPTPPPPIHIPEHLDQVRLLAEKLFDGLEKIHELPKETRQVLGAAGVLRGLEQESQESLSGEILDPFSIPDGYSDVLEGLLSGEYQKLPRGAEQESIHPKVTVDQIRFLDLLLQMALALGKTTSHAKGIQAVEIGPSWVALVLQAPEGRLETNLWRKLKNRWSRLTDYTLRVLAKEELASGNLQPFPHKIKRPGIKPEDPLAEAGRKILRHQFAAMLEHERGTRIGDDIEELHDMRVAVRRMRVCFEIFEGIFTKKAIRRHRQGLREAGRALGRVRDMDVFMEKAERYLESLDGGESEALAPLMRHWEEQRESARQKMLAYLRSHKYLEFLEDFNTFVHSKGRGVKQREGLSEGGDQVQHAAPRMIYTRFGTVRAYEPLLDEASIEQLHQLRIEFKRLRYTVEYFREVLGSQSETVIKTIKEVQDHLGDLNDADVACTILSEFLERWEREQQSLPLYQRENPEPIVSYLATKHAERHQLMVSFTQTWSKFDHPDFRRELALAVAAL
jgi:CHAD domain-containing protein